MDPEAVDVEAAQERRKRHNHDYAKTNEVTHGRYRQRRRPCGVGLRVQVLGPWEHASSSSTDHGGGKRRGEGIKARA
jgi:hypothetical protein